MIQYNDLRVVLEELESQISATRATGFPSAGEVRQGSPVQGFGLDKSTEHDEPLPIVVAVGGNYTQAKSEIPRDGTRSGSMVEDDLAPCRRNLTRGIANYLANRQLWQDRCLASSAKLHPPSRFHFVMTNFCLWITNESWQNIRPSSRADLLENNPAIGVKSSATGCCAHLNELAERLKGEDLLWVGHGMHCEVYALVRQFARCLPNTQWMLMPNLAFYYYWK